MRQSPCIAHPSFPPFIQQALLLLAISAFAAASDWTEFRGPEGQGHSSATNLPIAWSSSQNVAWKTPLPGLGWSSPVLSGGRVYLTTAVLAPSKSLSLRALCLEARTGTLLWNTEVFNRTAGYVHNKNSHASPTPLIEGERLYVHFGHQGTACLDLDGKVLWHNSDLTYSPVHGSGGSPIIVDDALIFSCDGGSDPFLVALLKSNGKVIWKVNRQTDADKTFSFSTPLLITVNGRKQVISPGSNALGAYDPATGQELWRVRYNGYSVIPRPVYGNGLLYISTGFDHPVLMAIRPDGSGDVTDTHVAWSYSRSAPNIPSLLLDSTELYMVSDSGMATCLDAVTGRAYWQERLGGNFSASPLLAEGRIYLQSEEGVGTVLKPGKVFQKLAVNPLGERSLASYAVADHCFFIRTAQNLYCIRRL